MLPSSIPLIGLGPGKGIAWRKTRILEPKFVPAYIERSSDTPVRRLATSLHTILGMPGLCAGLSFMWSQLVSLYRCSNARLFSKLEGKGQGTKQLVFVLCRTRTGIISCYRGPDCLGFVLSRTIRVSCSCFAGPYFVF